MKKILFLLLFIPTFAFGQVTGKDFPDYPLSGSIGTAASTIDQFDRIKINQTTPGITLSLPKPTNGKVRTCEIWVINVGTVPFTISNVAAIVDTGSTVIVKWVATKWTAVRVNTTVAADAAYIRQNGSSPPTTGHTQAGNFFGMKWGYGIFDPAVTGNSADGSIRLSAPSNVRIITKDAGNNILRLVNLNGWYSNIIQPNAYNTNITLPSASGTLALTTDIPSVSGFIGLTSLFGTSGISYNTSTGGISLNLTTGNIWTTKQTAPSWHANGTAGAGFIQLGNQSVAPSAVNGSRIMYSDASTRWATVRRNNANSADITHTYIHPDQTGTWEYPAPASGTASILAGLETAQTFTQTNTFTAPISARMTKLQILKDDGVTYGTAFSSTATKPNTLYLAETGFTQVTSQVGIEIITGNLVTPSSVVAGSIVANSIQNRSAGTMLTVGTTNSTTASTDNVYITTGPTTGAGTNSGSIVVNPGSSSSGTIGNFQLFTTAGTSTANGMQKGLIWQNAVSAPTGNPSGNFYAWGARRNGVATTAGLNLWTESGAQYIFADRMGVNTLNPSEMLEVIGNVKASHLVGNSSTPTISAGTGSGTSPSVSVTGTDMGGYISITTGTSPTLNATVSTITFNTAYSSTPRVVQITPANNNAAILTGGNTVYVDQVGITTTTFALTAGTTALTAGTSYKWYYSVIQ